MIAAEKIAYRLDSDSGVLMREGFDPHSFGYRDTSEEALIALFRGAKDLSCGSAELRAAIKDWPTEYHLSIARSNLLRGFDLKQFSSVLEIGCGCGAITRQLGEQGISVTALDGSLARATAARARCRDLSNVEVVCENFQSYEDHRQYDLVTLIGVLEYAPMFIEGEDPFARMLLRAKSFLKPGGVLLIAIENLLGLKYFAGHEEDHVGKPYWGIQGLYQQKAAKTFGRVEMDALLARVGFHSNHYYYPFPDYKVPKVIISERGVEHPGFRPSDILAAHDARSYNGGVELTFDEALVWDGLAANKLLPHMANSFLIWSTLQEGRENLHAPWLAKNFSISEVSRSVCETTFSLGADKDVVVSKTREPFSGPRSGVSLSEERYVHGENFLFVVRRTIAARGLFEEVAQVLKPWISLLNRERSATAGGWTDWKLPKDFFDCVPHNLILSEGELVFIDREISPHTGEEIDFSWVVVRGLLLTLAKTCDCGALEGMRVEHVIRSLCALFDFSDFEAAFARALDAERIAVLGPHADPAKPFFLKSFAQSALVNRVRSAHRLHLTRRQGVGEDAKDLNEALRLLSHRVAALTELQNAYDDLCRNYARQETELQQFRRSILTSGPFMRLERLLQKVSGTFSKK